MKLRERVWSFASIVGLAGAATAALVLVEAFAQPTDIVSVLLVLVPPSAIAFLLIVGQPRGDTLMQAGCLGALVLGFFLGFLVWWVSSEAADTPYHGLHTAIAWMWGITTLGLLAAAGAGHRQRNKSP